MAVFLVLFCVAGKNLNQSISTLRNWVNQRCDAG